MQLMLSVAMFTVSNKIFELHHAELNEIRRLAQDKQFWQQ